MTKKEAAAGNRIAKAFKAYRFREMMNKRIKNKPEIQRRHTNMILTIQQSLTLADDALNKIGLDDSSIYSNKSK